MITIFKELFKTDIPYHVSLDKIVERIKTGKSKNLINSIQKETDKDKRNQLKLGLPCILFSGKFSQRNSKSLVEHSGLMVIDFDEVENPKAFKEELKKCKHFILLFISPSGKGVKGVVRINPTTAEKHSQVFKQFSNEFKFDYIDESGSNVDRVCFESFDSEIYYNPKAEIYNPTIIDKGFDVKEKEPLLPISDEDSIIQKIMDFNWKKDFVEGQRNNFIFDLAGAFCEYGVNQNYAFNYIQNNVTYGNFTEKETETAIKSAYKLRQFGSKFFEDYKKKDEILRYLKYDKKEVKEKFKIDDETYDKLSEQKDQIEFWYFDKQKAVKIDPFKYKLFLESNGFRKYYPNEVMTPQLVQVISNKVKDTSSELIKDFVLTWLLDKKEFEVWKRCVSYQNLFSDNYLSMLESIELLMLRDTPQKCYVAYQNGIVEVTKNSFKLIDYIDVDGYIWENAIIQRDFKKAETVNDYQKFINNISNKNSEPIECVIGYLLCGYKNKMNNKAIILNDEVISENPEGGTGKGVFVQGIRQIKKTAILDGKSFDDKKSFPYQTVSQDTSILVFDDVKKNFDFESKFSLVTEGLTLERKNKDAIKLTVEESPKLVISTNYAIKGEGNSHDRRRHEIEFSQYYNKNKTPYDEFNRQLFDDWNKLDFTRFDNYMIYCMQLFLKKGLITQEAVNLKLRKFVAETSMEFYEWASDILNLPLNSRNDKQEFYEKFTNEYKDFTKLSRKRFNIWIQKYANYIDAKYLEGVSNGQRWFEIEKDKSAPEDIFDEKDEDYF